jgi:hypothetical protein
VERIRQDRVLHEALTAGPDPLHLALVFNLSHTTASRYAAIAQDLLDDQIEQATGQQPGQPRYASDEPTDIPGRNRVNAAGSRDESSVSLNSRRTSR